MSFQRHRLLVSRRYPFVFELSYADEASHLLDHPRAAEIGKSSQRSERVGGKL